ncbi:MAG: glycosyltransferase family 1 protein [Calditrichaeota bacterium]|nr:MAG: glycosyltransferase family 1 protein [Calditrichota bacterium]
MNYRPLKICDLTQSYTETSGGIRTYIHEKQKYILQNTDDSHLLIVPGEHDSREKRGRLIIYRVKAPLVKNCEPFRFIMRLDKVYKILCLEQPDIIELGSAYVLPYPAMAYQGQFNIPIVGFYHTDYPNTYVKPVVDQVLHRRAGDLCEKISYQYVKFIYNQFDATILSSIQMVEKLKKLGVKDLQHVYLGVDLQTFHPQHRKSEMRRSLGALNGETVFIYHGRFDHEKRFDLLLQSFHLISAQVNGLLCVIGEGPLKGLAHRMATENPKIRVLPYEKDRQQIADYLASADIYCAAGPHETFGLSIIEAQASGLAVCGVRAGALIERVPKHVGVLAEPNSIAGYAEALTELSQNGFKQKGALARRHVEERFSWEKSFSKIFSIYDNLIRFHQRADVSRKAL